MSDEELDELLKKYKARERYSDIQKEFSLKNGILTKEIPSKVEAILKDRQRKDKQNKCRGVLSKFGLSLDEANELFLNLTSWSDFETFTDCNNDDQVEDFLSDYFDVTNMDAQELLTFFRENSKANRDYYDEVVSKNNSYLFCDKGKSYADYMDYLKDCVQKSGIR